VYRINIVNLLYIVVIKLFIIIEYLIPFYLLFRNMFNH